MTKFLDVVPEPRRVKTHKYGEVEVTGLTISGIAFLLKRHPELFSLFKEGQKTGNFDMQKVIDLGLEVVADFLASGLGYPGDEEAVKRCRDMNPDDTWTIGEAIIEESFPGGAANFFEKVAKAAQEKNLIQASRVQQVKQELQEKTATH